MAKRMLSARMLALAIALLIGPATAGALPLAPPVGFSTAGQGLAPEGLTFNPATGTLFASDGGSFGGQIYEYQTDGTFQGSFAAPLSTIRGIGIRSDNGNVLYVYVSGSDSRGVAEYASDFVTPVTGAGSINFTVPCGGFCGSTGEDLDFEAVVFHADRSSVFVADDGRGLILEYDMLGNELNRIVTATLPLAPGVEILDGPSGLALDPATGNLIVTDDSSAGNGRIFEMTPDGVVLDATDNSIFTSAVAECLAFAGTGCIDGEGAAFDPVSRTLFLAFENEQVITGALATVPAPTALACLGLGLTALAAARRRRAA